MAAEFPRCVRCRTTVRPAQAVLFRLDGRVEHAECPTVSCPLCGRPVLPGSPIRRDGHELLHPTCWMRRFRASARAS